jgi:hypothetical protein
MANWAEIDKLFQEADEIASEYGVYDSPTDYMRQKVESDVLNVVSGDPAVKLLDLREPDLRNAKLRPISEEKLTVVYDELQQRGFIGSLVSEPGIPAYSKEKESEFTYLTHFRWLGNSVCRLVRIVAMERSVTRHPRGNTTETLGNEVEVVLFNAAAHDWQLKALDYKSKTILKFSEYREIKAA